MRTAVIAGVMCALAGAVHADDEFAGASVIFARGSSLYRVDPRGKGETEIATMAAPGIKIAVRALRTDAQGKVLLVDVGGKWSFLPLDGSTKTLTELPCADGPAQIAEDATLLLCRSASGGSLIVSLPDVRQREIEVPPTGTRMVNTGPERRVIWADKTGVWSALTRDLKLRQQVAAEAPLRSFLPSPDGQRAVGVYTDKVYTSIKDTKPADVLMGFALDGQAARRKAIKGGVPIEWSHDSKWVLVQDGGSACIMMANGGQYKCWKGYTGASVASDGRWGLVLGNRDGSKKQSAAKKGSKPKTKGKASKDTEPTDEPESATYGTDVRVDDVEVAPPSGPLALYRAQLEGAFSVAPTLIVKVVDGAAVWIPPPVRPPL
ncbi:hypothetical protein BH11MYX3_BH11MYX3_03090 [soil metagenome]